jgi:hypothetical protein
MAALPTMQPWGDKTETMVPKSVFPVARSTWMVALSHDALERDVKGCEVFFDVSGLHSFDDPK